MPRGAAGGDPIDRGGKVGIRPVIRDLGNEDEIEPAVREIAGDRHLGEAHVPGTVVPAPRGDRGALGLISTARSSAQNGASIDVNTPTEHPISSARSKCAPRSISIVA